MTFEHRFYADTTANSADPGPGLLLVGHGTRDGRGREEFLQTVDMVRRTLRPTRVEAAFLELAEPTIAMAATLLAEEGVRSLVVAPVLLFAAGHARSDIPLALQQVRDDIDIPQIVQTDPLDCHPELLRLSANRFEEAVRTLPPLDRVQTVLLLVGRGSRDDRAIERMHRFAELGAQRRRVARVETCFYAMARPSLDTALQEAAALPTTRVVVQPHLLYQGELLRALRERVDAQARTYPETQWTVTPHLGPAPAVARALVDRFHQARRRLPGPKRRTRTV